MALLRRPKRRKPASTGSERAASDRRHQSTRGTIATGAISSGLAPLYNGPDYLGDDPDPNIRSQILRDLTGRYGGID